VDFPAYSNMTMNRQSHRAWLWSLVLLAAIAFQVNAQTIAGLTVKAATNKHVDLSWIGAASSYNVQRRVLGGSYSTIATVTNSTYSDTQIDPYTAYEYQVVAGSSTSGSVRVGPPPAGLTNAAPAPLRGSTPSDTYGYNISLALDGNGDPAFVFGWGDPNGDSDYTDGSLVFRSWNRALYAWNAPVTVGVVGDAFTTFHATTSLAYDASTNTWAAASEQDLSSVNVYVSTDGGASWTKKRAFQTSSGGASWGGPSLALAGGNIHLALISSTNGVHYLTGKLSADPTTWTDKTAPRPSGTDAAEFGGAPSLALDSAGNPGIAYWVADSKVAYNNVLLFWKPAGSAAPGKVMDSQAQASDTAVKLVYYNLNPRVLVYTQRQDADFGVGLHFTRSDDGGISWQTPIVLPPDGNSSTDYPFDLTLDSKGEAAAAFGQNSGSGDATCGNPKISRSTDLTHWTTCAIAPVNVTGDFGSYPGAIQAAFGGNDKLYLLWWEQGDTQANTGVLMYREPPAGAATGPTVSSVVDGASFRSGIVAGSWVTIQGANLSDTTRTWGGNDFNNGNLLPTDLSGVQVKINGLNAAVYYISPTQLNVQAPANISGNVTVQVTHAGVTSNVGTATAVTNAPALFAYSAGGKTYPAAVYLNSLIVGDPVSGGTAVAKAHSGDRILLYGTGLAPSPAGSIVDSPIVVTSPVTVTVGSASAFVEFAGLVASGEFQINIVMPNLPPGEYPVTVTVAGQASQPGVVIPVQ
jgi:uncharacterized protein (TIGR03437 family)